MGGALMCNRGCICTYLNLFAHMQQSISMQTGQKNMENIYILPIYMFTRLNICVYGLHICIYGGLYLCIPTELDIYIYAVQDPKTPCTSHWCCKKLQSVWYNNTIESSQSYCRLLSRNISIAQAQS